MLKWLAATFAAIWRLITRAYRLEPASCERPERPGPYLAAPIVDVDFVDVHGAPAGTGSATLVVKIAASGLLVVSEKPVVLVAEQDVLLHSYHVWFGSDRLDAVLPRDVQLYARDSFALDFKLPIALNPDIGTNLWDHGPPDPKPLPPDPESTQWIARPTNVIS